MLKLDLKSVHAFWDNYDRRTLYRILVALEQAESWNLDDDEDVNKAMDYFATALDTMTTPNTDNVSDYLIDVLANISATRAIRILQVLDSKSPGSAAKLLKKAEEYVEDEGDETKVEFLSEKASVFLRRNVVFERLQLLSRIFSSSRLNLVIKSLEIYNNYC